MPLKAVLFDLDDTLFDHHHSCRVGLTAVHHQYACFQTVPFVEFERQHRELIEHYHLNVLQGLMTLDEARMERFRQLFLVCGETISQFTAQAAVTLYRKEYLAEERQVAGAAALMERLRAEDLRIGIVTNSTVEEQVGKLKRLKLEGLIEVLVVSEAVGIAKPDPRIFEVALQRLNCGCDETVMIGDSWTADVLGGQAAGIRAVWLNRSGATCPDPNLVTEIAALEPSDAVVDLILQNAPL